MRTTLYGSPSTAALVVHWLLLELQIEHDLVLLDFDKREHKDAAYLALNPAGLVPTLVLDGQVLTEAAAIALHLADRHPEAALLPAPGSADRAEAYRWMFWCANTVQPAYRAWFYPQEMAGPEHVDATRQRARERLEGAWQHLTEHLSTRGPYVLGESLSVVDFMLVMLMRWSRNMPTPSDTWPALKTYADRLKARPAFAEVYRREGITDWR
ncbi:MULTISPECIES: glutathione S-transferase family protein [Stenotrophomonas]|uniref:Glutathione S-transferase n=1 Tax=Stenotrophomonas rhizophila TaxID=216778 RepID=A0A498CF14_9GAMM|nr:MULTISPECIES: glutathione S-transferase family protein [Stenotrophomonas]MBU2048443.1 glutathione S-transferase family protein [Gammaproteobacteria bacterium]RLK56549.1 glutathione S-transferase [Stenotrophomonas rhizophila]